MWADSWLADLRRNVPGARALFAQGATGGLALLRGRGWRHHSEYLEWSSGTEAGQGKLVEELRDSFAIFRRAFGRESRSTVAPHYIFHPAVERAWKAVGVLYVQGCGYRILRNRHGQPETLSHTLGEGSESGLVRLVRTVKFEPRTERPSHGVQAALRQIMGCFKANVPAVVDSHRINYTGERAYAGRSALEELLTHLPINEVRVLSSEELGEAIGNGGSYHDTWSGEGRALTPIDPFWRRWLRGVLSAFNAHRLAVLVHAP